MKDGITMAFAGSKGWFHVCEVCDDEWTGSSQNETCPGCGEGCFSMLDEEMAEACLRKAEANRLPEKLLDAVVTESTEDTGI